MKKNYLFIILIILIIILLIIVYINKNKFERFDDECKPPNFIQKDGKTCGPCKSPNYIQEDGTCGPCISPNYVKYDKGNKTCVPCLSPNYILPSSGIEGICGPCKSPYYIKDGACIKCESPNYVQKDGTCGPPINCVKQNGKSQDQLYAYYDNKNSGCVPCNSYEDYNNTRTWYCKDNRTKYYYSGAIDTNHVPSVLKPKSR